MNRETVAFSIFGLFLALYFFATQKIYRSKYFFLLIILILSLSVVLYWYLNKTFGKAVTAYVAFLNFYYALVLLVIKLTYKRLNKFLLKIKWVNSSFMDKDFTYAMHDDLGDTYDRKRASKPSWLDFTFSYLLLFGPGVLSYMMLDLAGS